jgi:hypothetical protein
MRVFECTGQPGSGKTTLNRALLECRSEFSAEISTPESLASESVPVLNERRDLVRRWPALLLRRLRCKSWLLRYGYSEALLPDALDEHRDLLLEASTAARGNSEIPWMKDYARRRLVEHLRYYEIARSHLGEHDLLWIEDEGFVKGVTNIYGNYRRADLTGRITRYVSLCPKVDIILHIKVDPSTSLQRIRSRDGGQLLRVPLFKGMTDEAILDRLKLKEHIYELGVGAFRDRGSRVVEVETTDADVGAAVRSCREQLSEAIAQLAPQARPETALPGTDIPITNEATERTQ